MGMEGVQEMDCHDILYLCHASIVGYGLRVEGLQEITMAGMPCQKKKKKKKKGKADLTIVLHIRELPHLHMKLAVWFFSNHKQ